MPDLYDAIANGSYGRSYDRYEREPDFDEITYVDEDEPTDGEDADYALLEQEYEQLL